MRSKMRSSRRRRRRKRPRRSSVRRRRTSLKRKRSYVKRRRTSVKRRRTSVKRRTLKKQKGGARPTVAAAEEETKFTMLVAKDSEQILNDGLEYTLDLLIVHPDGLENILAQDDDDNDPLEILHESRLEMMLKTDDNINARIILPEDAFRVRGTDNDSQEVDEGGTFLQFEFNTVKGATPDLHQCMLEIHVNRGGKLINEESMNFHLNVVAEEGGAENNAAAAPPGGDEGEAA